MIPVNISADLYFFGFVMLCGLCERCCSFLTEVINDLNVFCPSYVVALCKCIMPFPSVCALILNGVFGSVGDFLDWC